MPNITTVTAIHLYIRDLLGIEFVSEINTKNRTRGVQIPPFIIPLIKKTMKTVFRFSGEYRQTR